MKLLVVDRGGNERAVDAIVNQTIMENIRNAGMDEMLALCGGCCSCATCHIFVEDEFWARLPPISEDEDDLLDSSVHRTAFSRLSCQIAFVTSLDGMRIKIAPED